VGQNVQSHPRSVFFSMIRAGDKLCKRHQGDLELHSRENLLKRHKLKKDEGINDVIQLFWDTLDMVKNQDNLTISKEVYLALNFKFHKALVPHVDEDEARVAGGTDWAKDTKGSSSMDFEMFDHSMFEIADMWVDIICADEYREFLKTLLATICWQSDADGPWRWKRDSQIVCCINEADMEDEDHVWHWDSTVTDANQKLGKDEKRKSLKVDVAAIGDDGELFTRVTKLKDLADMGLVHGTTSAAWDKIMHQGLSRMGRKHVHMGLATLEDGGSPGGVDGGSDADGANANGANADSAAGGANAGGVNGGASAGAAASDEDITWGDDGVAGGISRAVAGGVPESSDVLVYLDAQKMLDAGLALYRSKDGTLLCPGAGVRGMIEPKFFKKAVDMATGDVVYNHATGFKRAVKKRTGSPNMLVVRKQRDGKRVVDRARNDDSPGFERKRSAGATEGEGGASAHSSPGGPRLEGKERWKIPGANDALDGAVAYLGGGGGGPPPPLTEDSTDEERENFRLYWSSQDPAWKQVAPLGHSAYGEEQARSHDRAAVGKEQNAELAKALVAEKERLDRAARKLERKQSQDRAGERKASIPTEERRRKGSKSRKNSVETKQSTDSAKMAESVSLPQIGTKPSPEAVSRAQRKVSSSGGRKASAGSVDDGGGGKPRSRRKATRQDRSAINIGDEETVKELPSAMHSRAGSLPSIAQGGGITLLQQLEQIGVAPQYGSPNAGPRKRRRGASVDSRTGGTPPTAGGSGSKPRPSMAVRQSPLHKVDETVPDASGPGLLGVQPVRAQQRVSMMIGGGAGAAGVNRPAANVAAIAEEEGGGGVGGQSPQLPTNRMRARQITIANQQRRITSNTIREPRQTKVGDASLKNDVLAANGARRKVSQT
jgi:hypothetical protein